MTAPHQLDPHQTVAKEWLLSHPRGGLADEMRVGKTGPALKAAEESLCRRILILCPAHARPGWAEAIGEWLPNAKKDGLELRVVSYESYSKQRHDIESVWQPQIVILDEAHYLKSPGAVRTRAIYGEKCKGTKLIDSATYVWALTGTLAPNGAHELWTHWRALFDEKLTFDQWVDRYCYHKVNRFGKYRILGLKKSTQEELQAKMKDRFIRRTFSKIHATTHEPLTWDLVQLSSAEVAQGMSEEDLLVVERVSKGTASQSDEEHIATIRRLVSKLKVDKAVAHVQEHVKAGKKVLLFGIHRDTLKGVETGLAKAGIPAVLMRGGLSDAQRIETRREFQEGEAKVLVGQISVCQTNLDLSAADVVVFIEADWVPGNNHQAAMRSQKRGKAATVPAEILVWKGTIDEAVERLRLRKLRDIQAIYGGAE